MRAEGSFNKSTSLSSLRVIISEWKLFCFLIYLKSVKDEVLCSDWFVQVNRLVFSRNQSARFLSHGYWGDHHWHRVHWVDTTRLGPEFQPVQRFWFEKNLGQVNSLITFHAESEWFNPLPSTLGPILIASGGLILFGSCGLFVYAFLADTSDEYSPPGTPNVQHKYTSPAVTVAKVYEEEEDLDIEKQWLIMTIKVATVI